MPEHDQAQRSSSGLVFPKGIPRGEGNAYGMVLSRHESVLIPVVCTHGGSMWLCAACAREMYDQATGDA